MRQLGRRIGGPAVRSQQTPQLPNYPNFRTKMTRFVTTFTLSLICVLLTPFAARAVTIPSGTSLLVRTVDRLSSNDAAGKSFAARLDSNLVVKGKVVIPAGSKVYGRVESSRSAGRAFGAIETRPESKENRS